MMYQYMTLADETNIVHSHLFYVNDIPTVEVHFERPIPYGFDSARCSLPSYRWIMRDGFTDDEIIFFEKFLENNAHSFFEYAESGGIKFAQAI